MFSTSELLFASCRDKVFTSIVVFGKIWEIPFSSASALFASISAVNILLEKKSFLERIISRLSIFYTYKINYHHYTEKIYKINPLAILLPPPTNPLTIILHPQSWGSFQKKKKPDLSQSSFYFENFLLIFLIFWV